MKIPKLFKNVHFIAWSILLLTGFGFNIYPRFFDTTIIKITSCFIVFCVVWGIVYYYKTIKKWMK